MKKIKVLVTEPAAVAALKNIYETNGPGELDWDFSVPGQVTALDDRLKVKDGVLIHLNLKRAKLKGVLKLHDIATLSTINLEENDLEHLDFKNLSGLRKFSYHGNKIRDWPQQIYDLYAGSSKDYGKGIKQAIRQYRLAAEEGNPEAQFNLGLAYHLSEGIKKDPVQLAKAVYWLRLAAKQGHAEAQFKLSSVLDILSRAWHFGDDVISLAAIRDESAKWLSLAAEQRNATAMRYMGFSWETGRLPAGKVDMSKALKCYRLAAEQGDSEAQFSLGLIYSLGKGVEKDKAEAAKWLRLAAEQGHAYAKLQLGEA